MTAGLRLGNKVVTPVNKRGTIVYAANRVAAEVFWLERSAGRVGAKGPIETWQSVDFDTPRQVGATQSAGLSLVNY